MKRSLVVSIIVLLPAAALAQGARPSGSSAPAASARPRASGSASAAVAPPVLPAGHPPFPTDDDDDDEPSPHGAQGNPHGAGADPHGGDGNPHGGGANPHGGGRDGRKEAPQNTSTEDATLPHGTVIVEVRSPEGNPVASHDVQLGIVEQSIAKGESRRHLSQSTDASGSTTFSIPDATGEMAFRVSLLHDGASSAAPPFRVPSKGGSRVVLYAFPAVRDVAQVQLAAQGLIYLEPRDEIIQVEGAYRLYNMGMTSWVPTDVSITLPQGFKAFTSQKAMDDLAWDGTASGASFRGTLPPGVHETAYRFQLPNDGSEEMVADIGLLPNVQSYRVIAELPKSATLEVEGFPPAIATTNQQGQHILVTERTAERLDSSFKRLHVRIGGLPSRSKGRWWAAALAGMAVITGAWSALSWRTKGGKLADPAEMARAKELLLSELARLEAGHASGEIGPKTYARVREELLNALARLLAEETPSDAGAAVPATSPATEALSPGHSPHPGT